MVKQEYLDEYHREHSPKPLAPAETGAIVRKFDEIHDRTEAPAPSKISSEQFLKDMDMCYQKIMQQKPTAKLFVMHTAAKVKLIDRLPERPTKSHMRFPLHSEFLMGTMVWAFPDFPETEIRCYYSWLTAHADLQGIAPQEYLDYLATRAQAEATNY